MGPRNQAERIVSGFYTDIGWSEQGGITEDARRSEDLRPVASDYLTRCRRRVLRHIPPSGDAMLEVGSGPIQYPEYLEFSAGYDRRYCNDLSADALERARTRFGEHIVPLPGSFFDLDLEPDFFDCSISLHTIYHMDSGEQDVAVRKMLHVTKPGHPVVIVYSNPNSLMKRVKRFVRRGRRHAPGHLYFHAHPLSWWRRFEDLAEVEITIWRSFASRDQAALFPSGRLGRVMFRALYGLEEAFPHIFARMFQYPMVVLNKR